MFESGSGTSFDPHRDLPKDTRIVYKVPALAAADESRLTQSEKELRRYMQKNHVPRMSVSYMGMDNVYAYFLRDEIQWIEPPFNERGKKMTDYRPAPGLYAISANLIAGQFLEKNWRDYYKAFREAEPIDYAGFSIYIYQFR